MRDFSALERAFGALVTIPEELWVRLRPHVRVVDAAKGETLLRQGDAVDWLGFLESGLLRMVCNTGDREINLGFETEGAFVGGYEAYMTRAPARFALEALEKSVVLRFDRSLIESLAAEHACWRELLGRAAEVELVRKLDADLRVRTQTADERYRDLARTNPGWLRRVPQYHLASYLGVAPETLSRIRARTSAPPRASARS